MFTRVYHLLFFSKQFEDVWASRLWVSGVLVLEFGPILFFFVINFFFFFTHNILTWHDMTWHDMTWHNIQNITKQNNRHILNSSKSSQKGGREGRTIKTQNKSLLYTITYIKKKTLPSINWSKAWPHRLAPLYIHTSLFAGGYGSNMFFYTCVV